MNGGVLGQDGDAALALEVGVVHRPLGDPLVGAEDAALVEQRVDQRGLAVVDVGDDGDVAPERIGDALRFFRSRASGQYTVLGGAYFGHRRSCSLLIAYRIRSPIAPILRSPDSVRHLPSELYVRPP